MSRSTGGWVFGFIGVLIFSGSLAATRLAVIAFDPVFVTVARAAIAGVVSLAVVLLIRPRRPTRSDFVSLALIGGGIVIGFPLLTGAALTMVSSAHAMVFIGLLPLSTAIFAVLRGGEHPSATFWMFSVAGALCIAGFALASGADGSLAGDLLMVAAIVVCGFGYAEGGRLSRYLGGWQVICWTLVLFLPLSIPMTLLQFPSAGAVIPWTSLAGLGYVSLFSMLIGFVFWYRGLALGGIAAVGQLQLLQPFIGLGIAALVLQETISPAMVLVAGGVLICVVGAKRASSVPTSAVAPQIE